VVVLFKLFAKTEKITMEDSRKANGMLKYRLYADQKPILPLYMKHRLHKLNVILPAHEYEMFENYCKDFPGAFVTLDRVRKSADVELSKNTSQLEGKWHELIQSSKLTTDATDEHYNGY
jgi:hypothetical protein